MSPICWEKNFNIGRNQRKFFPSKDGERMRIFPSKGGEGILRLVSINQK
jgi:hypothetical protein